MSLKEFANLWESMTACEHEQYCHKFRRFKQLVESSDVVKPSDLTELFKKKIEPYCNVTELSIQSFECFKSVFIIVNEYLTNISDVVLLKRSEEDFPSRFERLMIKDKSGLDEDGDFRFQVEVMRNKLEGYTTLWKLAKGAENEEVAKKARNLLVYLHMILNIDLHSQIKEIREGYLKICFECLEKLRSEESPRHQILRCFDLVHALIDMNHMSGKQDDSNRPRLHCELDKGKLFEVKIQVHSDYWKRIIFEVYSNMLVCDLFSKCIKYFNLADNAEIYLEECTLGLIINTLHKTRTLSSLGIKDQTKLKLKIRLIPEVYLIQLDNTLNPKAKEIFAEWFDDYSDNGKMNSEQCTAFVNYCNPDIIRWDPRRITKLFGQFDDNKDSYLTSDNFLEFYFQACKQRQTAVWNDLYAHKRDNRLRKQKNNQEQNETNPAYSVASLISSNQEYIDLLFSLLESEDEIASKALELLNRLPTNPRIFSDIVLLKGAKSKNSSQKPDWSHIFDRKHKYKLFYCVTIVDHLAGRNYVNDEIDLWSLHPELLKHKETWLNNFHGYGGFAQLDNKNIVDNIF